MIRTTRWLSICLLLLFIGTHGIRSIDAATTGSSPQLDLSFGAGGLVTTDWSPGEDARLWSLLVQPDGKILLGGSSSSGARLVRYLSDGSLDPTFAGTGILTFSFDGSSGYALALAWQPDGKILVGGFFVPTASAQWRYVARLNEDGSFDPTFGVGGYIRFGQPGYEGQIDSLALQPDGKILVGGHVASGYLLGRLEEDGGADPGFGYAGIVTTPFPGLVYPLAQGIFLQPGGRIVLAGGYARQALARYESDGSLDPTFGDGGIVVTNLFDFEGTRWVGRQPDGKIIVGGVGNGKNGSVMKVARFDTEGALDATYGENGVSQGTFDPPLGAAEMGTVLPDGKVLGVGHLFRKQNSFRPTVGLTGLKSDGNLDRQSQVDTGMMLPIDDYQFTGMALQPDGRILAVGDGRRLDDGTRHWFVIRFLPRQSRIVLQEPL